MTRTVVQADSLNAIIPISRQNITILEIVNSKHCYTVVGKILTNVCGRDRKIIWPGVRLRGRLQLNGVGAAYNL